MPTAPPILAAPEVGQLVRVRDRHWVVTNVVASSLDSAAGPPSHLVELSSVEDDAFSDELTVFWEVEPGTVVLPKATLPQPSEGFDDPGRLAAFLDAVRWGAIASADARALQAPFRSGISIEDYQLDPVVRALQMPRVNLLIADDVGLGKTIEAGLVIQELLLRHRARTVLIVCPASLCLKWQAEMHDRFGLEFRIVDADAVKQLRRERGVGANIWTSFPRLIVSIDWLKAPRAMALEGLKRARQRGVTVRLILESAAGGAGLLHQDGADAFLSVLHDVELYVWPVEKRPAGSRLHAKVALADGEMAFVTSANFTGHALDQNLEVGVLVTGGQTPKRLKEHFHALIAGGTLARV